MPAPFGGFPGILPGGPGACPVWVLDVCMSQTSCQGKIGGAFPWEAVLLKSDKTSKRHTRPKQKKPALAWCQGGPFSLVRFCLIRL